MERRDPAIQINLARFRPIIELKTENASARNIFLPEDVVIEGQGYMSGHGTYVDEKEDKKVIRSSLAGVVSIVNKLLTVTPQKSRYYGEIGDVVVGRVVEVSQRRWKIEIKASLDAVLLLSSVNLPGGEIRRKSEEDETWMREYLKESDLISAEVQTINSEGRLSLNMRNLRYGKLCQGVLVSVPPSLVKHGKIHFHNLTCGVGVILGSNGFIWVSPSTHDFGRGSKGEEHTLEPFSKEDHEKVARVANCIQALARHKILLTDMNIILAYEASASLYVKVKDILDFKISKDIIDMVKKQFVEHQ